MYMKTQIARRSVAQPQTVKLHSEKEVKSGGVAMFEDVERSWKTELYERVRISSYATYVQLFNAYIRPYLTSLECLYRAQGMVDALTAKGLGSKTVRDTMMVFRMYVRYGVWVGAWVQPDMRVKYPAVAVRGSRKTLSEAEQRTIMQYIRANPTAPNLGIALALCCGLRIGEICALQWKDVDAAHGVVRVSKSAGHLWIADGTRHENRVIVGAPKTMSSYREVPLPEELAAMFAACEKASREGKGGLARGEAEKSGDGGAEEFIVSGSGRAMPPRKYREYFAGMLDGLGIQRIRFHGLRHTFATRCIGSGCDPKSVAAVLGHSSVAITLDLYVHPGEGLKRECVERSLRRI